MLNNGSSNSEIPNNSWKSIDEDEILEKIKTEEIPVEAFDDLVNSENYSIRQAIALNEQTPNNILDKLIFISVPRPLHVWHAPFGELKEKELGSGLS